MSYSLESREFTSHGIFDASKAAPIVIRTASRDNVLVVNQTSFVLVTDHAIASITYLGTETNSAAHLTNFTDHPELISVVNVINGEWLAVLDIEEDNLAKVVSELAFFWNAHWDSPSRLYIPNPDTWRAFGGNSPDLRKIDNHAHFSIHYPGRKRGEWLEWWPKNAPKITTKEKY